MSNGIGCKCFASYQGECACDADWTPSEVYELKAHINDLREALEEAKHSNSTEKFETMYDAVMYTQINYDDLMAWHEAQLGEPVAWMSVSGFEGGDGHEFIDEKLHNNDIPLYAKKG